MITSCPSFKHSAAQLAVALISTLWVPLLEPIGENGLHDTPAT